jgi:CRISPR-associated protein Csd1
MSPLAYSNNSDYLQFTACAVIRKSYIDKYKEEYQMALERDKRDLSYQFGRLLAVLEKAEKDTYDNGENRDTYAIRLQSAFCAHPLQTSKNIIEHWKTAYYPKLNAGAKTFYESLIGEIFSIISEFPESSHNSQLKETYILGYYLQKNSFYTKNNNINDTEETENE